MKEFQAVRAGLCPSPFCYWALRCIGGPPAAVANTGGKPCLKLVLFYIVGHIGGTIDPGNSSSENFSKNRKEQAVIVCNPHLRLA
jgi:hypothetical protein